MKHVTTMFVAFALLCAAGTAGAQDLKTLTTHYKAVIEDGNQQMDYGAANANLNDNCSACINAGNAAEDYCQALVDLMPWPISAAAFQTSATMTARRS